MIFHSVIFLFFIFSASCGGARVFPPANETFTLTESNYQDYITKYNPFNGTNATLIYTKSEIQQWTSMLATASNESARSKWTDPTCWVHGLQGLGCMYDETAKIMTANCGERCSTFRYVNGVYYGYVKDESSGMSSRADRCCFNHDIALDNRGHPINAFSSAACPIHRTFYNCMVAKHTAWGMKISGWLVNCMGC